MAGNSNNNQDVHVRHPKPSPDDDFDATSEPLAKPQRKKSAPNGKTSADVYNAHYGLTAESKND